MAGTMLTGLPFCIYTLEAARIRVLANGQLELAYMYVWKYLLAINSLRWLQPSILAWLGNFNKL